MSGGWNAPKEKLTGMEDTKDTKFTCEICEHTIDKIYMGRVQDVCEACEAKADRDEDYQ